MKQVKSVEQVIDEMNATDYAALGIAPPNWARVEALVKAMAEWIPKLEASLPKPWDEMTNEEQDAWFDAQGVRELTSAEVVEYYGGYGHATVIALGGPRRSIQRGSLVAVEHLDGSWHNQMRAMSAADGLVYVADEAEYPQAQTEVRAPLTIAYPQARVKPADK